MAVGLQAVTDLAGRLTSVPVAYGALVIPVLFFIASYDAVDQSRNVQDAKRTEQMLEYVGPDALLLGLGYHDFYYAMYYLVGEQWQQTKRIYAPHYFRPDEIVEFVANDIPVTLVDQGMNTPVRLKVYVRNEKMKDQLTARGLTARAVEHELWLIE